MKFKEKNSQVNSSTQYVPEHFDSKSISGPSNDFMETVREIEGLDFIESSAKDFTNLCRLNIPKQRS